MEDFKPEEVDFVGVIKKQMYDFIGNSEVLDDETKTKFKAELGHNWHDDRFDGIPFIKEAIGYSRAVWENHNFELIDLWKQTAINNSKVDNEPFITANKTVAEFKKQFKLP